MRANEQLYEMVNCLNGRERCFKAGQIDTRIEYQIAKEDPQFSVLMITLIYPQEHKSQYDNFSFAMFFYDDAVAYNKALSSEFDKSLHIEALEVINKFNKEYYGSSFAVYDSGDNGMEKIVMHKYLPYHLFPTSRAWELAILEFSKTGDLIFSEHLDELIPFYN